MECLAISRQSIAQYHPPQRYRRFATESTDQLYWGQWTSVQPEAPAPIGTLRFDLSNTKVHGSLPLDLKTATQLVAYSHWALSALFQGIPSGLTHTPDQIFQTISNAATPGDFVRRVRSYVNEKPSYWCNVSVANTTIEFSHFALSPQIDFDGLTFELPLFTYPGPPITLSEDGSSYLIINNEECGELVCVLRAERGRPLVRKTLRHLLQQRLASRNHAVRPITLFYW